MGGMVDRRRIREQEDWVPKELRGDVGSAKLARHEVNMCRAPLCSSMFINPPLNIIILILFPFLSIPSCQFILLKFNVASKRQQFLGPIDRTGICVCTDIAISAYYFCILKILCTLY